MIRYRIWTYNVFYTNDSFKEILDSWLITLKYTINIEIKIKEQMNLTLLKQRVRSKL